MAKILKKSFLNRIAKRITKASEEFRIENGFELVEVAPHDENSNVNPVTGESLDFMDADITTDNFQTTNTTFSAELSIVNEIDIIRGLAGGYPIGTILIFINSAEIEEKGFTLQRLETAQEILIKQPVVVDKYGSYNLTRSGSYKIESVTPNFIKDRMIEVVLQVKVNDKDVSN